MNLIQQANMLKGLSDEQLQSQLSNPSGSVPPFLLTVEAQRRVDSRRMAGVPQSSGTVIESLKSQLGQGTAPPPMAPQMPQQQMPMQGPPSTGLGALSPQPPQQFAGGGAVANRSLMNQGFPLDYSKWVKTLYDLESFGGKNVVNPESGTFGPYQFKRDTYNGIAKRLGLPLYTGGNPPSLADQQRAYEGGYFKDTLKALNAANIPDEHKGTFAYISHKYGQGAVDDIYDSYLQDSQQPISNVLTKLYGKKYGAKAVKQNRLTGMSVGDEIARLSKKFGERTPTDINMDEYPNIDFGVDAQGNPLDQFQNNMLDSLNQPPEFQEPMMRAYTDESAAAKQAREMDEILKNIELITMGKKLMDGEYQGFSDGGEVDAFERYKRYLKKDTSKEPPIKLGDIFNPNIDYRDMISGGPIRPMQADLTPNQVNVIGLPQVQVTVPQRTAPDPTGPAPRTGQDVYLEAINKSRRGMGLEPLPDLNGGTAGDAVAELDRQASEIYGTAGEIWNQPLTGRSRGARTIQSGYQGLKALLPAAGGAMLNTIALPLRGWDYMFGEYDENGNPYPKPSKFTQGGLGIIPSDGESLSPDMGEMATPGPIVDDSEILSPEQIAAPMSGGRGAGGFDISDLKKIISEVEGIYPEDPKQVALQNSIDKYMGRVDKERETNKWMSLATTGFNMMGGVEGEAPFFGNAVRRGTNAGLAQYMAGNEALAKQEAQGIAGLGDIAKMSADRRDKILGAAAGIYEKQIELAAKQKAAESKDKYGYYVDQKAYERAFKKAEIMSGIDTLSKSPVPPSAEALAAAQKKFTLLLEQYENEEALRAADLGNLRTQRNDEN